MRITITDETASLIREYEAALRNMDRLSGYPSINIIIQLAVSSALSRLA
jgi:hypothetical protein